MLEVRGIAKLEAALDEISDELHHQYSLGYYPENKNWDGKFRKIQISAGEKDYKVHARKGYYATLPGAKDRKSTRLNSSHGYISYAVFCLKKKRPHRSTPPSLT